MGDLDPYIIRWRTIGENGNKYVLEIYGSKIHPSTRIAYNIEYERKFLEKNVIVKIDKNSYLIFGLEPGEKVDDFLNYLSAVLKQRIEKIIERKGSVEKKDIDNILNEIYVERFRRRLLEYMPSPNLILQ